MCRRVRNYEVIAINLAVLRLFVLVACLGHNAYVVLPASIVECTF